MFRTRYGGVTPLGKVLFGTGNHGSQSRSQPPSYHDTVLSACIIVMSFISTGLIFAALSYTASFTAATVKAHPWASAILCGVVVYFSCTTPTRARDQQH